MLDEDNSLSLISWKFSICLTHNWRHLSLVILYFSANSSKVFISAPANRGRHDLKIFHPLSTYLFNQFSKI